MRNTFKVLFYAAKGKEKNGIVPIMGRVTVNGQVAQFSCKLTIAPSLWDVKGNRAKGKGDEAQKINHALDKIKARIIELYNQIRERENFVTAEMVRNAYQGVGNEYECLLTAFDKYTADFDKRVGVNRVAGSAKVYWNAMRHVKNFLAAKYNLSDIPFTALDRSFIEKYDLYLRTECKLAPGTIVILAVRLGTIINHAIADGIITADPFAGYERKRPAPKQKYLPREELQKLMTTPLASPAHYLIRDLFLFACYTGISYSDVRALTEKNLSTAEDGTVWIRSKRRKNGNPFEIPLLDLPLQILDRYRGTASKGRLLPMYSNSQINLALKAIAKNCGIERPVNYHTGRHRLSAILMNES